jgi:hypothetical protein
MLRIEIFIIVVALATALASCGRRPPEGGESVGATVEAAAEPTIPEPGGTYVGGGTDPHGKTYTCETDVTRDGAVYFVVRRFEGRVPYDGVGIRRGDLLVVAWRDEFRRGVIVYNLNRDGSLTGTSAYEDATEVGTEFLKKK